MPDYRLYCLDDRNHVLERIDFEAIDDTDALKFAGDRDRLHLGCEIWGLGRKIFAELPPKVVDK